MNGHHPQQRPTPAPAAGAGSSTEDLVLWLFGWCLALIAAVSAVVWSTAQIAGALFGAGRPTAPVTRTPGIALRLRDHVTDPAAAWPAPDHARLPEAAGMYAALVVTVTVLTILVWAALRVHGGMRRPGRWVRGSPRPVTSRPSRSGGRWRAGSSSGASPADSSRRNPGCRCWCAVRRKAGRPVAW